MSEKKKGGFVFAPFEIVKNTTDAELKCYCVLVHYCTLPKGGFPSAETIARDARKKRSAVFSSLKSLEKKGLIVRTNRKGLTNVYSIPQTIEPQTDHPEDVGGTCTENYISNPSGKMDTTRPEKWTQNKIDINKKEKTLSSLGNVKEKFRPLFYPTTYPQSIDDVLYICKRNNIVMTSDSAQNYLDDRIRKQWSKDSGKHIELNYIPYDLKTWSDRDINFPDSRFWSVKNINKLSEQEANLLKLYVTISDNTHDIPFKYQWIQNMVDEVLSKSEKDRVGYFNEKISALSKRRSTKRGFHDGNNIRLNNDDIEVPF